MEKYNLPHKEIKRFEVYEGANTKAMPKLRVDGRVPANVSQIMQRRLDLRNDDTGVKDFYMDKWFDSGDAVVYHPDGRTKIVLDSQHLRDMTPDTPRNSGALIIGEDIYKALEGEEFKKGKLGKTRDWISKKDVKAHPVWKALARDQGLLNDYTDFIFGEYQARFAKDTSLNDVRAMGIFPGSANGDTPEMRAWCVDKLGNVSVAVGRSDLDNDIGRLLGIAPEALSVPGKGASNVQRYTMTDLQDFDKSVKGLEGALHP